MFASPNYFWTSFTTLSHREAYQSHVYIQLITKLNAASLSCQAWSTNAPLLYQKVWLFTYLSVSVQISFFYQLDPKRYNGHSSMLLLIRHGGTGLSSVTASNRIFRHKADLFREFWRHAHCLVVQEVL